MTGKTGARDFYDFETELHARRLRGGCTVACCGARRPTWRRQVR